MDGLAWTAGLWGVGALMAFGLRHQLRWIGDYLTRPNLALLLALLGTFSVSGQSDADAVLADPVVIERVVRGMLSALAMALAGPVLVRRMKDRSGPGRRGWTAIVVYLGVATVTTLYSVAPLVTIGKVFELTAAVVAVGAIAYGPDPGQNLRRAFALVLTAMGWLLLAGVIGYLTLGEEFGPIEPRPGFVSPRTLSPPYAHSNAMSSMSAIVGVAALARLLTATTGRWVWRSAAVVAFVALVLSSGRQGVVMYLVGVTVVLVATRHRLLLFAVGPAVVATALAYWDVIFEALSRDRPDNMLTLTGRLGYWDAATAVWLQHPWTGWGYGSGGRFVALESIDQSGVSSLHSGYFEALTGVGLLGVIPLAYAVGRALLWSWERLRARSDLMLAATFPLLLIRTGVSLGFGGWLTMELVLFLLIVAVSDFDLAPAAEPASNEESPAPLPV